VTPALTEISVEDFKKLVTQALNLQPKQAFIVDEMARVIQEYDQSAQQVTHFTREMIDDFFNLCHYWPLQVKKSANQASKDMVGTIQGSNFFQEKMQELANHSLLSIVELLGLKIQQRFHKASDAYMYFA
jgi:EF-hand domain pair